MLLCVAQTYYGLYFCLPEHRCNIVGWQDSYFACSERQSTQPALLEFPINPHHLTLPQFQLLRAMRRVRIQRRTPEHIIRLKKLFKNENTAIIYSLTVTEHIYNIYIM